MDMIIGDNAADATAQQVQKKIESGPPTEGFYKIMELAYMHMTPLALNAALILGIPDIIAKEGPEGSLSLEKIVEQLPRKSLNAEDQVGRILRILVLSDVFTESFVTSESNGKMESRFGLTHLSKWLVKDNEFHLVPMVLMKMRREMVNCFMQLHAVLDGIDPFEATNGTDLFHYTSISPGFNRVFNDALTCRAKTMNWTVANHYAGFHDIKTLVDVGGCRGQALASIVGRHPHIQGINFDLPHVIATAPAIPGVKHVSGDMFDRIPQADAVLMEQVLHDWNDEKCLEILKKCYDATPANGKVMIRENVLRSTADRSAQSRVAHAANLGMLSYCGEGKERTADEWQVLISEAGFSRLTFLNYSGLDLIEVLKT
ncbi:unnamed protein product [Calypogeia fissa]